MKKNHVIGWLAAGLLGCSGAVAQAATLSGSFTADDYLQVYLSSDLTASAGELVWNKQSGWGATESFSGVALAPGQSVYLLIDAQNVYSGPAMFIGDFQITGSGFQFSNGTTSLSTDTTHWTVSESSFASASATPVSLGTNQSLQIWNPRPGISGTAEAIWPYYADWSQGYNGHAYFVTQITAVPEPTEALMFALGLAGLSAVVRRQRRR